nr:hypothetical protein [Pseudomonas amygdali]
MLKLPHAEADQLDLDMMLQAALQGWVAQLPELIVREALQDGRLVELLVSIGQSAASHVFASRRGLLPAVRGLLDVFETSFKELSLSPDSLYCSLHRTNSRIQDH